MMKPTVVVVGIIIERNNDRGCCFKCINKIEEAQKYGGRSEE